MDHLSRAGLVYFLLFHNVDQPLRRLSVRDLLWLPMPPSTPVCRRDLRVGGHLFLHPTPYSTIPLGSVTVNGAFIFIGVLGHGRASIGG